MHDRQIEALKRELILQPLESAEALRDWIYLFFDIFMPLGHMYHESNSSSVEAMWEIYCAVRDNTGNKIPGYTLMSSRDSYKCQVKGSKLLAKTGLVSIEDVKIGDTVWSGKNWRKITDWIDDGYKDGIKLTLKNNIELTSTPIHRYWILRSGVEQWERVKDLKKDDLVCYNLNTSFSKGFETNKEEFDNGYFLGILAGDGDVSAMRSKTRQHIAFTTIDENLKQWFYNYVEKQLKSRVTQSKHDPITYCIWDKKAISLIAGMGIEPHRSWEKTIPKYCYTSNSAMMGFVSGLFDTDGTYDNKNAIDFPITADKILKELQIVFASWGINAKFRSNSKKYGIQKHLIHHLIVNAHEIPKLFQLGFTNQAYKAGEYKTPQIYDAHDTIPFDQIQFFLDYCNNNHKIIRNRKFIKPKISKKRCVGGKKYNGITYGKLKDLLNWLEESFLKDLDNKDTLNIINRVKNILNNRWFSFTKETIEKAHFYDLTVEEDHSYWSNGSISHNTLSASMMEVLLMLHFRTTIAHAAAIESQAQKAVEYCNSFMYRVKPYLEFHGWRQTSSNKRRIELLTDKLEVCYIQIIILTMRGANCLSLDTVIHYKNGDFKLAKDVNLGDKILSWDFWANKDVEVEIGSLEYTNKFSREVVFEDGSNIVISDDNMILTQRGWLSSANLRLTDTCKDTNKKEKYNTRYTIKELDAEDRDLDQVIIGTVLGDASILQIPSGKCRYSLYHCKEQLTYLEEIKKVFDLHGIESKIRPDRTGFKLLTKTNKIFEKYRELFYIDGIKKTDNVLESLTDEGISYWFMDDVRGNGITVGARKEHCFELATCCFTYEEHIKIIDFFNQRGFKCKIGTVSNSNKTYNIINFNLQSSRDLSEAINPYFINNLRYKLLNPTNIRKRYRTIDQDELVHVEGSVCGFQWSDHKLKNKTKGRKFRKEIKPQINKKIKKINIVGKQDLIDIEIKTDSPHLHSFYANNVLVHNSAHTNLMFIDEVDLCDPAAYQEAKMIPGVAKGRFPLTVRLSTRKFAFGLMEKEIKNAPITGEKVLRWNILDVCAHCPESRCKPNGPTHVRYIPRELPLRQVSPAEFKKLEEKEQNNWEKVVAYGGCLECPLLSICKTHLHNLKPKECEGNLWKPVDAVINVIRAVDADVAEAQLLCHKPSTKGLVYSRFTTDNVVTIQQAWKMISGLDTECTLEILLQYIHDLGIEVQAGVDWGYTNQYAIVIAAIFPNQTSLILDTFAAPELELEDCVRIAEELQEKYHITKFFADQAYPAYIKTFNRKGLSSPKFTKDVEMGVEAVRGRIVNAANKRSLFVLDIPNNKTLIEGFNMYHFKLDAQGNVTDKLDHCEYSDIMDAVRYYYQNVYGKRNKMSFAITGGAKQQSNDNNGRMQDKIDELATNKPKGRDKGNKRRIFWS